MYLFKDVKKHLSRKKQKDSETDPEPNSDPDPVPSPVPNPGPEPQVPSAGFNPTSICLHSPVNADYVSLFPFQKCSPRPTTMEALELFQNNWSFFLQMTSVNSNLDKLTVSGRNQT